MTKREKLAIELKKLISIYPEDNRNKLEIIIGGYIWKNNPQSEKCLDLICNISEYEIFNNHTQWFGNSGIPFKYDYLLDWLLSRSRQVEPVNAISELDFYTSNSKIEIELVQLLKGSTSDKPYRFSNGVLYINMNTIYSNPSILSSSLLAKKLCNISLETPSNNYGTGILITYFKHSINHLKEGESYEWNKEIPYEKLEDARLCLSLVLSIRDSLYSLGTSISIPDNIPQTSYSGQVWKKSFSKESVFSNKISNLDFEEADKVLSKFEQFDLVTKNKLRISLERLNNFGSEEPLVDRAIELRICLESIFLNDGNKEQLRFRLALRAALFLGKNLTERKSIFKTIKTSYDITSAAVHSGKLPNKGKTNILFEAANLAKSAIIKLIKEGLLNWENLELKE
jgi:hypothetical protein